MSTEALMEEAREIAEAAGALTLKWYQKNDLEVNYKVDGTEVTEADRAAEALIREQLLKHHPEDAVVGEEQGGSFNSTHRTWVIDPIDGTRGFVKGIPLYSTLIALVDEEGPLVGVIHLPVLGLTMVAGRENGCWLDDQRCRVSTHPVLDKALINTSSCETYSEQNFAHLKKSGAVMRTWGDGYGYFLVASGRAEAMVDPVCSVWDLAPVPIIIEEAGGKFSNLLGEPGLKLDQRSDRLDGLATNGLLHNEVLATLGKS